MAEPFVGEIRPLPYGFAPRGWFMCDGRRLSIAQYQALFAVISNRFGGDGKTSFDVPNLQDRVVLGAGSAAPSSLTPRPLGATGGVTSVTLTQEQTPPHAHGMVGTAGSTRTKSPVGAIPARPFSADRAFRDAGALAPFAPETLPSVGGGKAHDNMMPTLTMNFVIAYEGMFPPRS